MRWLLALALLGCGKTAEPAGSVAPPPPTSDLPAELAAWMPKDAVQAWQGSYTTRMPLREIMATEATATEVVLDVKGESAKGGDGTKEYPLGFSIVAPCIAGFEQAVTDGKLAGTTLTHTKQFVIKDGRLIAGDGGVGMRTGMAAIVCQDGADKVITVDVGGTCKTWDDEGGWKSKPIECAWGTTEDGKDQLTVANLAFVADGDLLMDRGFKLQLERTWHQRHASYDAAKQALAVHKRP